MTRLRRVLATLALLVGATVAQAATYQVGVGQTYPTIATLPKLVAGDVVEIQPGTYTQVKQWPIAGMPASPVVVKCLGPARCLFDAAGVNLAFTPRAIFQVDDGAYTFIGPFSFRNAHNGGLNAAAVRTIRGTVVVDGVKIRNSDNGVTSSAATSITVRNSDIGWSGMGSAAGHSVYLSGDRAVVEDNIFFRTIGGMHVKVRARDAVVRRNQILDSTDGEIQCGNGLTTTTPGADCVVVDNVIRTLAKGRVNCCRVIAFGHEGRVGTDRNGTLRLYRNKITVSAPNQVVVSLDSVNAGFDAVDNTIEGTANLIRVRYGISGPITGRGNKVSPVLVPPLPVVGRYSIIDVLPHLFVPPSVVVAGTTPPTQVPDTTPPTQVPDTTPPTQVTNVTFTVTPTTPIILTWTPSVDAGGIAYYEVMAPHGPFSMGDEPTFVHTGGIHPGRSYTYVVTAVDKAGNRSIPSEPITVVRP